MKKVKRLVSATCICCLLLAVTSGCGRSTKETSQSGDSQGVSEKKAEVTNDNFNKTGLPIVKEKVTYRLLTSGRSASQKTIKEKEIFKKFEEETNVHIEWEEIPDTGFKEKMNIMLNSGSLPDGVFAASPDMADAVASNLLIPYDDYMEYAPNMKKMFETVPETKIAATSTTDGKIYKYPGFHPKEYAMIPYPTFINKTWLDQLNLKMPTTTKEFEQVLQAFKDNDCNGNGDKDDEIPLVTSEFWGGYWFKMLFGAWGLMDFGTTDKFATCSINDGVLSFNPVNPKYREALEYFHGLYEKGLMQKDCMTIDDKTRASRLQTEDPVGGVLINWTLDIAVSGEHAKQYVVMPPLKGPEGDQKYPRANGRGAVTDGLILFKGCKNPEILVRWIDYLNGGKNPYMLYGGLEGDNWKIDEKTKEFIPIGLAKNLKLQTNEGIQNPPGCRDFRYTGIKTQAVPGSQEDLKPKWGKAFEPYAFKETWISIKPITPSTSESREVGLLLTDLSAECQSFIVDAVTNGITDSSWDKHVKNCEQLEYKKVVAFWQDQYDTIKKIQNQ